MNPSVLMTLHNHSDDIPWVEFGGGTKVRVLHARPSEDFIVTQIQAAPRSETRLHRHLGPVFGWTNEGRWGHDLTYEYRPGTYVFEPPGVIHKFHAGNEPVEAVFVSHGVLEYIDPKTLEVTEKLTVEDTLNYYLHACDQQGLARPNVLA